MRQRALLGNFGPRAFPSTSLARARPSLPPCPRPSFFSSTLCPILFPTTNENLIFSSNITNMRPQARSVTSEATSISGSILSEDEKAFVLKANFDDSLPNPKPIIKKLIRILKKFYEGLPSDPTLRAKVFNSHLPTLQFLHRAFLLYPNWQIPMEGDTIYFLKTLDNKADTINLFTDDGTFKSSKFFLDRPDKVTKELADVLEIDGLKSNPTRFRFMFDSLASERQISYPISPQIIQSILNRRNIELLQVCLKGDDDLPFVALSELSEAKFYVLGVTQDMKLRAAIRKIDVDGPNKANAFILCSGPEMAEFHRSLYAQAQGLSLNEVSSVPMRIEEAITLATSPGPEPVDVLSFSCGLYDAKTLTFVNVTIDAMRKFLGVRGFE